MVFSICLKIARLGAVHMVRDVIVIYRMHEAILSLRSLNVDKFFSYPKSPYIIMVVLTFIVAL